MVRPSLPSVHHLTRADARRIAVRAQRLTADRPTDVHETVHDLWLLLLNPTAAVAPSADLVLWSRIGSAYDPRELADALDEQSILEYRGTLRVARGHRALPRGDGGLAGRGGPRSRTGSGPTGSGSRTTRGAGRTSSSCCAPTGRCPISELPDTCVRPWRSTGWNNNRNVTMLLGLMVQMGDVAAAGGTGRDRLWDLAERVYPPEPPVPLEEAFRVRDGASARRARHRPGARTRAPGRAGRRRRGG